MLDQKCSDCFKPLGNVVKPPFLEMEVTPACASPWLRYFLLGSPSLAWDNRAFFRLEQESYTSRNPLNAMVYASCGGKEQGQIQNLQDFKQLLDSRAYPDLSITTEIVEGRQQLKLSVSRFLRPWASHMHSGAAVHSQMIRYVAFSTPSKSFRIFILPFCHTLPLSIRLNYRRIVWQSSTFCITFQDSKLLIYCKWVIPRSSQSLQASSRLQLWKEHQFARQTPFHHFSIWFIMFHLYNNSCVSLHNFCLFTSTSRRGPWLVVLPLCLSFDGLAQRSPWSPKRCVEKETSRANKDVGETSDNEVEWIEDVMPSHF